MCRSCGEEPSTEVDHIIPVSQGGGASPSNAQGLCATCHKIKTAKERGLAKRKKNVKRHHTFDEDHCGIIDHNNE